MKILFVAMASSIHTARWISQLTHLNWDLHLFCSTEEGEIHNGFKKISIYRSFYPFRQICDKSVKRNGIPMIDSLMTIAATKALKRFIPKYRVTQLKKIIQKIRPDIIHSLEIQHAGYLTLVARKTMNSRFPPWIVTNWGSDIYLYGRLSEHQSRIKEILALCDYYSCECQRDVYLAKQFGFKGVVLPVVPNAGGFDLAVLNRFRSPGKTSSRRLILLKGYQTWAGRALVGLRALERCSDLLKGYRIAIYSASPDVEFSAKLFNSATGIPVTIIATDTPNIEILKLHGLSRISIGLSIGDAISTSFLEAIVMGSFPIQSWTSCANEWIEDGKTGILVPPEDPEIIEKAIRKALLDDELVDNAADINAEIAREYLAFNIIRQKAVNIYETVYSDRMGGY